MKKLRETMKLLSDLYKSIQRIKLRVHDILYVVLLSLSLLFYESLEEPVITALVLVLVYNFLSTSVYINIGKISETNKRFIDYINYNKTPLTTLFCFFILRFLQEYSVFFSLGLAVFFISIVSYSRSYIYLEEYVRLCSAIFSVFFQTVVGSSLISTYLSMTFLIVFGRLGMEFLTKTLLRPEIITEKLGGIFFYRIVFFYIKISKLRQGKKGILFNVVFFSLLPNFWILLFYNKIYLSFVWSFFLILLLIANTSYCLFVTDPRLSVFVAVKLMKKYPYSYKNKLLEMNEFVIRENYYVLDSEKYKLFGGSGWLVMKYLEIKEGHVMAWAALYLYDFKRKFVTGIKQSELQTEINDRIMKAVFYFQQMGNIHENIENKDYLVGNHLLKLAIADGKDSDKKLDFCKVMNLHISKELSEVDHWWEIILEKFFIENKDKGLKGEGMLRNMGSAMNWARIVI